MKIISICAILTLILAFHAIQLIKSSGLGLSVEPMSLLSCESLSGPVGAEDITIDPRHQIAYIGADDRRAYLLNGQATEENGAIWSLDLSKANTQAVQLTANIIGTFHPHGIALHKDIKGEGKALYVVNHISPSEHAIEIFDITEPGSLKHRRSVSYPEMISPNDLVVVAKDQFFVTNDHGYEHNTLMNKLEDYLGLAQSSVTYFDGSQGHIIIEGLSMANGIELSLDQQTLYVAETLARKVSRYRRGDSITDWIYQDSVSVEFAVDNLEWHGADELLVAGHPKAFDFLAHVSDNSSLAPSEVAKINVSGEQMKAQTIYRNAGEELSGASVAAQQGDTLLIGPVVEPHFLRCKTK